MPWIMQMVWFAMLFIGVAFALWISFWLLVALFGFGLLAVIWSHVRDFLLRKGILNPNPGVPMGDEANAEITIVEGDYTRVDVQEITKSE